MTTNLNGQISTCEVEELQQCMVNVDWLQIHFAMNAQTKLFLNKQTRYKIEQTGQTKLFKKLYGVTDTLTGLEFCSLWLEPNGAVIPAHHGIMKVANHMLYSIEDLKQKILDFFELMKLDFLSVTRCDFAYDFTNFQNGWLPERLIKEIAAGNVIRANDCAVSLWSKQKKREMKYNGMKVGSASSEVKYTLYNKTLEMYEVRLKPYIVELHKQTFGASNPLPVWRLEFRVDNFSKTFGKNFDHPLDVLTMHNTYLVLVALIHKMFDYRIKKGDRVERMERLNLISFVPAAKLKKIDFSAIPEVQEVSNRADRLFLEKMERFYLENEKKTKSFDEACLKIMAEYINKKGLSYWAIGEGKEYILEALLKQEEKEVITTIPKNVAWRQLVLIE